MSEDRRTVEQIIPVIQEDVVIGTERATTGTVRVRTVIHEDDHALSEPYVSLSTHTAPSFRPFG